METELVTIILHHYPERLECAICCNVPFIFSAAKALIWPWLPEKTRQKVLFLSDAAQREAVLTRYCICPFMASLLEFAVPF